MLGSSIIDTAIGLVFVYLLLSLICSAASELIERFSKKRAKDLESGLSEMLRDPNLVESLYKHPLIYCLFPKPYKAGGKNLPSYIPARNFALALMDIIKPGGANAASGAAGATGAGLQVLQANIGTLRDALAANDTLNPDVKKALLTLVDAGEDPGKVRENIEGWFDTSMDRVSGWYKRRSQLIVVIIGLVLAVLLNVDTVAIVRALYTDRAMRDSLVVAAQEYAKSNPTPTPIPASAPSSTPVKSAGPSPARTQRTSTPTASPSTTVASTPGPSAVGSVSPVAATTQPSGSTTPAPDACAGENKHTPECRVQQNLAEINKLGLPIGWTREPGDPRSLYGVSWPGWAMRILGWLLTALALSLGAPFWFDMLNKFIVVRSTVKPKEKSPEEKS